jgi:hypothetical protein
MNRDAANIYFILTLVNAEIVVDVFPNILEKSYIDKIELKQNKSIIPKSDLFFMRLNCFSSFI